MAHLDSSLDEPNRSSLTRRSFLKTTGVAAGAVAASSVFSAGLQAFANDEESLQSQEQETVVDGRCFFGGCFSCPYHVTVRDGHAVKVTPNKDALYGRRPCLRGLSHLQRLYAEDRIKYPMKRVGERGSGEWERISWDEAIDEIAEKWSATIAEYGGRSIAVKAGSSGCRFLALLRSRLCNMLEVTTFDMSADWAFYQGVHRVYGNHAPGIMTTPGNEPFEDDAAHAKTIFMWGHNISESYIQRWRTLMDAQEQGAQIIAIDPNHTTTTMRANKHYKPRPGSDPALYLGMCNIIINEELHDIDYLMSDTVGPYLVNDKTGLFLRMSDLGVEPVEGPVDMTTGMPTVIDLPVVWDADANKEGSSAEVENPALEGSYEVNGIKVSTAFTKLVKQLEEYSPAAVAEITGLTEEEIHELALYAVDGPVSHMTGMGAQSYDNGLHVGTGLATLIAVTGMVGKPGAGIVPAAQATPMNPMPLFPTGTFATSISVLNAADLVTSQSYAGEEYPPIKALFIAGANLVGGVVDMNTVLTDVIDNIDFVVCMDVAFTDSARMADIVLPAAHFFEVSDLYMVSITNEFMYADKVVEPAFEAKPDQEMVRMLARAMGLGDFFEASDEEALEELLTIPALNEAGITYEAIKAMKTLRYMPPSVIAHEDGTYATSTGKVEFYSENPPVRIEGGQERDIDKERLPRFFPPYEAWEGTEAMEKYPLILISERSRNRFHSAGFEAPWLLEINPEPSLRINAEDAQERGINDGDYVEVYNDRGHAVAKASYCAGMRRGMMSYPKGMQRHQYKEGSFSELSQQHYDPFAVNSSFFDTCVEMRKWNGGS